MESVGVIGAGQMGKGIAQVCLQAGFKIFLYDQNKTQVTNARIFLEKSIRKFSENNFKDMPDLDENLIDVSQLERFPPCDLLIEAATENMEIKKSIFKALPMLNNTILATNTSSININILSSFSKSPEHFIGLHFMNPVPYMQLIEIITHKTTSEDTLKKIESFVGYLNKTYIISADSPGFVVNRILLPMINEGIKVLHEGVANATDIDLAMRLGSNHPMGPLELADFIGLDTCLAILNVIHTELQDDHYAPCPLLKEYVEKGWLGRKTKRGFYNYD